MKPTRWITTIAVTGALLASGCKKAPPPAESVSAPNADAAVAPPPPIPAAEPLRAPTAPFQTNTAERVTMAVKAAAEQSFAVANWASREELRRAMIACQIGDYAAAEEHLKGLAEEPGLTEAQRRELQDLLARVQRLKSQGLPNSSVPANTNVPQATPAGPSAGLDWAAQESYRRAVVALQIEDYSRAAAELEDLVADPQLLPEQKQALQELLTQTRQRLPAPPVSATNQAAEPPPGPIR